MLVIVIAVSLAFPHMQHPTPRMERLDAKIHQEIVIADTLRRDCDAWLAIAAASQGPDAIRRWGMLSYEWAKSVANVVEWQRKLQTLAAQHLDEEARKQGKKTVDKTYIRSKVKSRRRERRSIGTS